MKTQGDDVRGMADTVVAIMAGGQGSRFWPLSRAARPKQFLSLGGADTPGGRDESLIQATYRRVQELVNPGSVWVVSNSQLVHLITEHVPEARIVCEPLARNTAACVGLVAVEALVQCAGSDPVLVVLPADHVVKHEENLRVALREAIAQARSSAVLVTVGIPPSHPHTGYGYIRRDGFLSGRTYRVQRFFEKPSLERATKYLEEGGYFWNSGMFAWRASVILDAFRVYLPAMYTGLMQIKGILEAEPGQAGRAAINRIFSEFESISVDFGVLEHAQNCVVVDSPELGWSDVGSWDQWAENFSCDQNGNLIDGDAVVIDSTRCVVKSERRLIAAVGVSDLVVIDAGDALLVVARDRVQDVRKVVEELKGRSRLDLV